ncbi:MAG TPA: F0F1 ATP synthase subunit B [Bacteroidia bacterium]|nr:F0F1 ATP synthase subunit B [Bacteroidia bacterium]
MDLILPSFGLIFWMTLTFVIVFWVLKKFAWKPILGALKDREKSIQDALDAADRAKKEMELLQSNNEKILMEARAERDSLLKEARETKDSIINEAKGKAQKEATKLIQDAREAIQNEKSAALAELKSQVATLSIEIAEKILKSELSSDDKQKSLVNNMLKEVSLN